MPLSSNLRRALSTAELAVGLTHDFYRYPARFSPTFAREIVAAFTAPGDLVLDPFSGGATTAVEAYASGRSCVGTDISSLAIFLGEVKTTLYTDDQLANVKEWSLCSTEYLTLGKHLKAPVGSYERNLTSRETWAIRAVIASGLETIDLLDEVAERKLARCIWLRTGQWALDSRRTLPRVDELREKFVDYSEKMISEAACLREAVKSSRERHGIENTSCVFRQQPAADLHKLKNHLGSSCPKLVVTSPPYPGVHVLYHRWQIKGRKETPAPFWISGTQDGHGAAHYTLGGRSHIGEQSYFHQIVAAFQSLWQLCDADTSIVQMLAFSNAQEQLPRYLDAMSEAGFEEQHLILDTDDRRLWRDVPRRKWQALLQDRSDSGREVVLVHRARR